MIDVLNDIPIAATVFAVPQFLPQIRKLRATRDSATFLAGTLAVLLTVQGRASLRPSLLIGTWAALLVTAYLVAGRAGLGALLTAAFAVQVAPSIWTAYRTARPTGISSATWLLILGELTCWMIFGLYKSDPRLITLGVTGVTASALMLARIHRILDPPPWPAARRSAGTGG